MAFVIPSPRNSFHLYENIPQKKWKNVSNKAVREKRFKKNNSRCWKAESKLYAGVSEPLVWGRQTTIFQETGPEISSKPDLASELQRLDTHHPGGCRSSFPGKSLEVVMATVAHTAGLGK